MKKIILTICALFLSVYGYSQVGINTTTPQTTLDVTGAPTDLTKLDGVIAPRITREQLQAKFYTTAQTGAIIYVEELTGMPGGQVMLVNSVGYYYFDGNLWHAIGVEPWNQEGTTNSATANAQNIYQMGKIGIKTNSPNSTLDVNGSIGASFRVVTGNTVVTDSDHTIAVIQPGSALFTLPDPATCSGRIYRFINYFGDGHGSGGNEINFNRGVYYFDGTSLTLGTNMWTIYYTFLAADYSISGLSSTLTIQSNGIDWYAVGF